MTTYLIGLFVVLMIVLIVVVVSFAIVDRMLKGGSTKKVAPKSNPAPKKTPAEKPKEEPSAVTQPIMNIYNSELADDLNEMLKSADATGPTRLQIENHIDKESNIAKYLQSKNYHGFNFGDDYANDNDTAEPLSFTREDYKRIVALSNIDDQKPL